MFMIGNTVLLGTFLTKTSDTEQYVVEWSENDVLNISISKVNAPIGQ